MDNVKIISSIATPIILFSQSTADLLYEYKNNHINENSVYEYESSSLLSISELTANSSVLKHKYGNKNRQNFNHVDSTQNTPSSSNHCALYPPVNSLCIGASVVHSSQPHSSSMSSDTPLASSADAKEKHRILSELEFAVKKSAKARAAAAEVLIPREAVKPNATPIKGISEPSYQTAEEGKRESRMKYEGKKKSKNPVEPPREHPIPYNKRIAYYTAILEAEAEEKAAKKAKAKATVAEAKKQFELDYQKFEQKQKALAEWKSEQLKKGEPFDPTERYIFSSHEEYLARSKLALETTPPGCAFYIPRFEVATGYPDGQYYASKVEAAAKHQRAIYITPPGSTNYVSTLEVPVKDYVAVSKSKAKI